MVRGMCLNLCIWHSMDKPLAVTTNCDILTISHVKFKINYANTYNCKLHCMVHCSDCNTAHKLGLTLIHRTYRDYK